jgi:hypothetical protein
MLSFLVPPLVKLEDFVMGPWLMFFLFAQALILVFGCVPQQNPSLWDILV